MAESRRSWPWKKKEKVASAPDSTESSPRLSANSSKSFDDNDSSKVLSDHNRSASDVSAQWQQSEAKFKNLSDKLAVAITEITAKDSLVKQHAKVAEEAVSGWEKAEAEAAVLKQQLDLTLQQKLATEDRVSHLDGALKECMKQLRHVREEQEQRIHETLVKKTREYDKLRQDMEAKLADYGQHLQQARAEALELRGESRAVSNALQERNKVCAEVSEGKARAEAEVKVLQVRLETTEKENANLKYELHVLNKELEIRTEEKEYERKATENATKQHLENVKKIAKLEAESQRLRILVRKKLPGPAALAQMKQEADALGAIKEIDVKRRKSLGRTVVSRDSDSASDSFVDNYHECSSNKETESLTEKMAGMDDELKLLKEVLARREVELQASRLMCAKTASKLSHVEEQLEIIRSGAKLCNSSRTVPHSSLPSRAGGGDTNSVEAWEAASALVAELDQFKKSSDKPMVANKLDLMDDFAEMEKLAMASETETKRKEDKGMKDCSSEDAEEVRRALAVKEGELEAASRSCLELQHKLSKAEELLAALHSRNAANETVVISLQEKLDKLSESHQSVKRLTSTRPAEEVAVEHPPSLRNSTVNEITHVDEESSHNGRRLSNGVKVSIVSRSSSDMGYEANEDIASVLSDAESKASTMGSDLLTTIRRVVRAVEALAEATGSEHENSSRLRNSSSFDKPGHDVQIHPFIHWKNVELEGNMQGLTAMSNKLLLGKADMVDFLGELTAVISYLVNVCTRNFNQLVERIASQSDTISLQEKDEELRRVRLEKVALESHMRAEMGRLSVLETELDSTRREKVELERSLEATNQRLDAATCQLRDAEKVASEVHVTHDHVESQLHDLAICKTNLEREVAALQKKVASSEVELQNERRRYQEVVAKYHEYQQQLHSDSSAGSVSKDGEWRNQSADESEFRLRQEREFSSAAEKLAECQRSILDLGKQLKAFITLPRDGIDPSYDSDTASSIERVLQNGDQLHSTALIPLPQDSENIIASDTNDRTGSGRSRDDSSTPWSTPRTNSISGSPFTDRRRSPSPSPPQLSRASTSNGHNYPGSSYNGRPPSGEYKRETNGYHVSGGITPNYQLLGQAGTSSEYGLLGSLSVPASPARSSSLPFRPRGTSPMRSEFSQSSSSGNGTKEGESEASTMSFSRLYARTKSNS